MLFATRSAPSPEGNGGNHRSYQVEHELREIVGPERVVTIHFQDGQRPPHTLVQHLEWRMRRARDVFANPLRRSWPSNFVPRSFLRGPALATYRAAVAGAERPVVCVTDYTGIAAGILAINTAFGVRTAIAPQTLDSLDCAGPGRVRLALTDLEDEISILARCSHRLLISKVETGLLGGIGFCSTYYPYRPVDRIESSLLSTRARRATSKQRGFLLMIGSAGYGPIGEALRWLLEGLRSEGLPPGVTLAVAGQGTRELLPAGQGLRGVELLGFISNAELETLLSRASAVLVPGIRGFGAQTRLPELSCAGVPVLASSYCCLSIDVPPGVHGVPHDLAAWREAIARVVADPPSDPSLEAYRDWRTAQRPFPEEVLEPGPA